MEGDTRVTGKKTRIFRVNDLGRNEVERMMESWGWGWVKKIHVKSFLETHVTKVKKKNIKNSVNIIAYLGQHGLPL